VAPIRTEIAIIGGGVIGNSIAYHLARLGRRALVIERGEVAGEPAASWASAGGVRRQGRHPAEALLAIEANGRWRTLEEELEADMRYRRGGQLLLAENEEEARYLEGFVKQQQAMGFDDVRLVDGEEARARAPGLNPQVIAGSYSPGDGQADPPATTRAFARAAQRLGAGYWTGTAALALITQGERVTGVKTERGDVEAEHVVLAAGAWSDELARVAGLPVPIRTFALQMLLSTPAPAVTLLPVLSAVGRRLSLKQLDDGAFFLGGGWPGDATADRRGYRTRAASIEGNWATACGLLPAVGEQCLARAWCGLEAQSIDGIPFAGAAPGIAGLTLALGFSGHGFALAPAVGRAVADQINGQRTIELDGLSPARMAGFAPEQVERFVTGTDEPADNSLCK
jgi:glycine/D-amino acid oxidase-like deaminating enzyme